MNCSFTDCEQCPYYIEEQDLCEMPEENYYKPLYEIILGE